MMKRVVTFTGLMLLAAFSALLAANGGGLSPLFSRGAGGRALGMGGANVALASDASAIFWNPATLTNLADRSVSLMYLPLPEGTNYSFAAFGLPTTDYGSFSVAAFLLTTGQIQRRDDLGRLLGEFNASQQMYLLGYGKTISRRLAVGGTIKLYGETFDNTSSYGAGGDLGIKLTVSEHVALGLTAQNLVAPKIRLESDAETLPRNFRGGLGVTIPFSSGRNQVAIEVDADKTENMNAVYHVGAELGFLHSYFLRGGYDVDQMDFGAGVHLGPATFGYAYRTQDALQAQHQVTLDISIGGSIAAILARRDQEKRKAEEEFARRQREQELTSSLSSARGFYDRGSLDSAETYYVKVDALSGGTNTEAVDRLAEIRRKASEKLSATVRAGVLAETDSVKAAELFADLGEATNVKDIEAASLLLDRLRPAFGNDPRFVAGEARYKTAVTDQIGQLSLEAARNVREDKLADAAVRYNEILKLDPNNAAARRSLKAITDRIGTLGLLRSGVDAYYAGDTTTARQNLEKLIALNPADTAAQGLLVLLKAPAPSSSLAEIQKNDAIWKLYLEGIEKFRQGEYQAAIDLWEQVLAVYPRNPESEKNIQQAKLRLQQNSKTN
jgi:tetratricopeptide (TPR) repeat protein